MGERARAGGMKRRQGGEGVVEDDEETGKAKAGLQGRLLCLGPHARRLSRFLPPRGDLAPAPRSPDRPPAAGRVTMTSPRDTVTEVRDPPPAANAPSRGAGAHTWLRRCCPPRSCRAVARRGRVGLFLSHPLISAEHTMLRALLCRLPQPQTRTRKQHCYQDPGAGMYHPPQLYWVRIYAFASPTSCANVLTTHCSSRQASLHGT